MRPIDLTAERLEVQDRADRAIFAGNVKVRQDELTLDTSRLTVAYSSSGGVQIKRLDAERRGDRAQPVGDGDAGRSASTISTAS